MQVGATRVDITPPRKYCKQLSLGGYSRLSKCKGIRDRIYAKIIYFKDEGDETNNDIAEHMIISIDQSGMTNLVGNRIRTLISRRFHIPIDHIFIYCSHNHYTPDILGLMAAPVFPMLLSPAALTNLYINFLIVKILHAIPAALNVKRAKVGIFQHIYPDNDLIDRRLYLKGKFKNVHPKQSFIGIKNSHNNDFIAIGMISSLHDVLYPPNECKIMAGQTGNYCNSISALTADQEDPAIGFFMLGPSGNINPIPNKNLLGPKYHKLKTSKIPRSVIYQYQKDWGEFQAKRAISKLASAEFREIKVKSVQKRISFPINYGFRTKFPERLTNLFFKGLKHQLLIPILRKARKKGLIPLNIVKNQSPKKSENTKYRVKTNTSILKIDELALLNTPGEPFLGMGQDIESRVEKNLNSSMKIHTTSLCNDSFGYMFTDKETIKKQTGYEPKMTLTPLAGTYIMNSLITLSKDF